jgi:hypothetical protein
MMDVPPGWPLRFAAATPRVSSFCAQPFASPR